jgi:sulfate adenylyltransferase subunit 1
METLEGESIHILREVAAECRNPALLFSGADICWLSEQPLDTRRKYLIKHGTRTIKAWFVRIEHRIEANTSQLIAGVQALHLNDIARVGIKAQYSLVIDSYATRATGSFIVIDEATNNTIGAGMIA